MDFNDIINHLPVAVFALDSNGDIVYANACFEKFVAPFARVKNLPFADEFINSSDTRRFNNALSSVLCASTLTATVTNCQTLCFGSNDFPLYKSIDWMLSGTMKNGHIVITGSINEKLNEKENDTEHELIDFFQNAPIAMHWLNSKGIIIWANKAELSLLGYSSAEYLGHYMSEVRNYLILW